ncbi:MAG: TIGR03067 domain-containing protein, partial [Schlesneria sp.]
ALTAAIADGEDSKVELAKFNGTWELLSATTDGKEMPPETVKTIRLVIKDGKHTVYLGQTAVAKEIPFTVDSTRVPMTTIDTLPDGKTIKGIFKLEGETLTSCVSAADQDFPREFSSKPGSGYSLRVFKRCAEEKQSLEGVWVPVDAELAGVKLPVESLKSWKLTLNAEKYHFENGKEADQGTWTLDTSKTPQAMDITGTEGPNKGKTILAICQLSKESLRICYDLGGKSRPTEFTTKPGTPLFLVNYQRK